MYMTKMFLLLYADDIVIFADSAEELQKGLDVLLYIVKDGNLKSMHKKLKLSFSENVVLALEI